MARVEFLRSLARIGVPAINLRDEEIESEIRAAREMAASWFPRFTASSGDDVESS